MIIIGVIVQPVKYVREEIEFDDIIEEDQKGGQNLDIE
jgi:hypothetical protein